MELRRKRVITEDDLNLIWPSWETDGSVNGIPFW
jgi:hypothetical protein